MSAAEDMPFPVVETDEYKAGRVNGPSGLALWKQSFYAPGEAQGAVLFIHGGTEHSSRHDSTLKELRERLSVNVFAYDQQGHGYSEGLRGLRGTVESFKDYVNDALFIAKSVAEENEGKPLVLSGYSFGGLVACHVINAAPELFVGIFLGAPQIDVNRTLCTNIQEPIGHMLAAACPDARIPPPVWPHQLSKDKSVVKEFLRDPLNKVDGMRACYASASLKGSRKLRKLVDTFPAKKISICFGGDDTVTSLKAAQNFIEQIPAKSENKKLKVIPGVRHFLFHAHERQEVVDFMVEEIGSWIYHEQMS